MLGMEEIRKVKKKKKKRYISSAFYWIVSVLAAIGFFIAFVRLPMIPKKWSLILALVLLVILGLGFAATSRMSRKSILVKTYHAVFTLLFLIGSFVLPSVTDRISELFEGESTVRINCYIMSDSYKDSHTDIPWNANVSEESVVENLGHSLFITSAGLDSASQVYAQKALKETMGTDSLQIMDRKTLAEAVESLYTGEGDILILNSAFESMIKDTHGYESFTKDTKVLYTIKMPVEETVKGDSTLTEKPFSIFFGGNDEEGELYFYGHTDVDMIVTVNPNSHQIAIVSFPRDSYVENPALNDEYDKLTHLALSGLDNTLESLDRVLGTKINNYVLVNYTTFRIIINALGGIEVDNPYAFEADDGEFFDEGIIHLDGNPALMYVRERNHLPDGDFGRSMHQQLVMKAIIQKITSPDMIIHFNDLLTSLNGTFLTNVSSDALYGLVRKQLDENISWNMVNYHLLGEVGYGSCAAAYGQELSVVFPYTNQIRFVSEVIQKVLDGDIIEQEELPDGNFE